MKSCLVLGDARTVREDASEAFKLFTPDAIFACNNIGIHWEGDVEVWTSLHPGPCHDWVGMAAAIEQRLAAGRNKPEIWGHQCRGGIENRSSDWGGSTGLLAVKVAREKGYDRIVLAGVPMSPELGHFYEPRRQWGSARRFHGAWRRHLSMLKPFVRSCSGWTREMFGAPDESWLAGNG